MILSPAKLEAGEAYASVDDILLAADLPETIIRVYQWKRNGQPLVLRVRALSLEQKERILFECRRPNGTIDNIKQIEATMREGCLLPKFDPITAAQLRHKNPDALQDIYETIWSLSSFNQDMIDAVIAEQTGAQPAESEPQPEPAAAA